MKVKENNPKQAPQLSLDAPMMIIRGMDKADGEVKVQEDKPKQAPQLSLDAQ